MPFFKPKSVLWDLQWPSALTLGGVWFVFSNNNFQFLNNITRIFTNVFKQQFSDFKHIYQTGFNYNN